MKGTARRGRDTGEDERAAAALAASSKERAENVMIVDLLRNDLGRVARTGSVTVTELFAIERYRTVLQMTSTVEARVAPAVGLADIFAALFPCGSVTGAPKIAATRLIAALERSTRGPYCGAIGVVAPGGDAVFNVGIRTLDLDLDRGAATYGVGGGITWGSSPEREWDEAMAKAAVLEEPADDFELLETLRLSGGVYERLESAPGPARRLGALLRVPAGSRGGSRGPRLGVAPRPAGRRARPTPRPARWTAPDRGRAAPGPPRATRSRSRSRASRWIGRTASSFTRPPAARSTSAAARSGRTPSTCSFEPAGRADRATIGNLVADIDGELLTPALDAGLLAGTMRAELLDRGEVSEAVLRREDLGCARRLWLVNSLRGWVPIRLV